MLKSFLLSLARVTLLLAVVTSSAFVVPRYHEAWLRSYVGEKVVKLYGVRGGGTGVHIETPKGETYILSNAHVCALGAALGGYLHVENEDGSRTPRAIIKESIYTDLCLIEPMPGVKGLKLGSSTPEGTEVSVIGHPKLMPLTRSKGELIGMKIVDIISHIIAGPEDKCEDPKYRKDRMQYLFWEVDVCILSVPAYLSNIVILPGNSGSPLVNDWGQLIGLAFAADNDVHWGLFIPLEEIQKFIAGD